MTIHATKVGDGTHGGFVGRIESDCKTFTFTDCKFNGRFDGSNTDNWCPFAAWSMGNDNTHFTFNNCLYAPASANVRGGCATFYRNGTATLNGAYYTQAIGTVQGTNASGMSNETLVGNLGDGWEIRGDQVVLKMNPDIVNPVFRNVTVKSDMHDFESTDHKVQFCGTYDHISWTEENPSILFLGAENQLHWPDAGASLGACRAYFQLTEGAGVREFKLSFGDDTQTIIGHTEITEKADAWYTVNGVKLSGVPTTKGLYIHGGRKVIVK